MNILKYTFSTILLGLIAAQCLSQPLFFTFVAPEDVIESNFPDDYDTESPHTGYLSIEIDSVTEPIFKRVAPPTILHLYNELQEGKPLRKEADKLLEISLNNVFVEYILVDDRTGMVKDEDSEFATSKERGKYYVWPSASNRPNGVENIFDGWISMGEKEGAEMARTYPGGMKAWESTALHEILHTQFVNRRHKWPYINQYNVNYGKDDNHYEEELLGSQHSAFEEGFGNFFSRVYNPAERLRGTIFFQDTSRRYFVESRSFMAGQKELYSNTNRRKAKVGSTTVFRYYWQDVPGKFLLFSESTTTYYMLEYWSWVFDDKEWAMKSLIDLATKVHKDYKIQNLPYAVNFLAFQMEAYSAFDEGEKLEKQGKLTSSMFPFALLDVITHFGMSEEEYKRQIRSNYPDFYSQAFTEYWTHRAHVKSIFDKAFADDPELVMDCVEEIHTYFLKKETILKAEKLELLDPFED